MVGRERKIRRGTALAGSHQRCWVWGRNAVLEILRASRWMPMEVIAADRLDEKTRKEVASRTRNLGVELETLPFDTLTDRCRSTEHQGLMAKMPEFVYATVDECLGPADAAPFVVVLDSIQDPHNFGAVVRSAEVFGAHGILIGRKGQCEVTAHVARTSAGAVNHVPIARVEDLADALQELKQRNFAIFGAAGEGDLEIHQADLKRPVAVILGNEGSGLSPELRAHCDQLVRIPQVGRTESLNAAVAAGILCYEVHRQRTFETPAGSGKNVP